MTIGPNISAGVKPVLRRWLPGVLGLSLAGLAVWAALPYVQRLRPPIRVGILHSLTGPMAISETSMVDAEVLALEEINASGGLNGRRVEWVVADGRSDPATFAREAERLISTEKVSVIFGCWTSACRKSVKPVVERAGCLLFYPVAYEGLEQSPNIIYGGAAPNQQIIPTVKWSTDFLKGRRYYLLGTDSVWPHAVNTIVTDQLKALGAEVVGEAYLGASGSASDVEKALAQIVGARPDVVLSSIEGEENVAFYTKLRASGSAGAKIPVVSFSMTEDELSHLPAKEMTSDYLVCNYFQAIDRPENREFVRRFKARYGENRVTSDPIATAHTGVRIWAQAYLDAESEEIDALRAAVLRQSINAPEGIASVDRETQHTWRPFFVGKVRGDGQVEIVWSAVKPIRPVPFPFSRTRSEWEVFIEGLKTAWNGNWEASARPRPSTRPG